MMQVLSRFGLLLLLAALAGCGAVRLEPKTELPPPLIDKLPETIGVYYPAEFREYLHMEERNQVKYEFLLGPAHVIKLQRLLQAMFASVVEVDDPTTARAVDPQIRLVIVPRFEDYAFLTPRDMAGDYYTVTIRYRLDLYSPSGERVDGYVFTGFGREKSSPMATSQPLVIATQRAMRDAGAKLAVEFSSQDSVMRLLAGEQVRPQPSAAEQTREALGSFGPAPPAAEAPVPAMPETAGPDDTPPAEVSLPPEDSPDDVSSGRSEPQPADR